MLFYSPFLSLSLCIPPGLLQSVDDLSVTQINSSFINISFVPPHTLHNVPIASYHLTLRALHTNTTTSVILSNTTLSSLLPLPTQCEEYSISITPVNGAGDGYTATQRIKVMEGKEASVCVCVLSRQGWANTVM